MRVNRIIKSNSSFLSLDKDVSLIIDRLLKNNKLIKLLYHTVPDALNKEDVSEKEKLGLINKNIRIVPKLDISGEVLNYIIITFDNFIPNENNPEFRDNIITFDIICHFDQWLLENSSLRPYKIAGEIDALINNTHLSGIGKIEFLGANQLILNDEFAGITLMYSTKHDGEDTHSPNNEEEDISHLIEDAINV